MQGPSRGEAKKQILRVVTTLQENEMAKSIGIVASATHRFALDTWNKLDTIMKSGRLTNVAKIAGVSSS